jgi:fatty-acyl-CoA synthase
MLGAMADATKRLSRLPVEAQALFTITRAGLLGPERPSHVVRAVQAFNRLGALGAGVTLASIRHGNRPGLNDELGTLTFGDLERRSNALANAFRARGISADASIAILCRNHRGMVDATFGALKVGARVLYLNTDFAAPQAIEVCARESVDTIVHDEEFTSVVKDVSARHGRFLAWTDEAQTGDVPTIESLIATGSSYAPPRPVRHGRVVILTSGTTGTPKGANREQPRSLVGLAALLSRVPFRGRQSTFIAPPMYHALGLSTALLTAGLGSTMVMRRRATPEETLEAIAEQRCTSLIVVPVILSRLLRLGEERIDEFDLSSLRIILSSGSQLDGALATEAMDRFGDVLYNLYGSTEVAYVTIADPSDLRAAPGCAGKPPLGTSVRILDDHGVPVTDGATGRIFVNNGMEFGGYTGGGNKEIIDDHMSTGDVGHFDGDGRLFVDGRDDEMIVSGGENVFPREIEDLLAAHPDIVEAAAVGVPDDAFGQRLRAFVVRRPRARLSAKAVQDYVKNNLARYKVPRDVIFVDELPRNPSGKVLKRHLVEEENT